MRVITPARAGRRVAAIIPWNSPLISAALKLGRRSAPATRWS